MSKPTRRERPEPATVWSFVDRVLVRCPRCDAQAIVRDQGAGDRARLTCPACAHTTDWPWRQMRGWCYGVAPDAVDDGHALLGAPFDPWFRAPLWLQTPCCGELLWAYNQRHVAFLRDLVQAGLRAGSVHPDGFRNQLLESRLPKWLLAASNRDDVLRGLDRLATA